MNRYGSHTRPSSFVMARYALALVLVALLILFVVCPITLYKFNPIPSSTVFVRHPDIMLSTYEVKPSIDGVSPSTTARKVATLIEQLPSQPMVSKRANSGVHECITEVGYARVYCELSHCISFFGIFQFWYPGCEYLIDNYTPYCVDENDPSCYNKSDCEDHDDDCWESYEAGWYKDNGLERLAHFPRPLKKHVSRGGIATSGQEHSSPNSHERLDGKHGPAERLADRTQVSSLETRSSLEAPRAHLPYNSKTDTFVYLPDSPNGNFCMNSGSFYIIRCLSGVGRPRNCNANLVRRPPMETSYSPCWETSPTSGDNACSKK